MTNFVIPCLYISVMTNNERLVLRVLLFIIFFNLCYRFLTSFLFDKALYHTVELQLANLIFSSLYIHAIFALTAYLLARAHKPYAFRSLFAMLSGILPLFNIIYWVGRIDFPPFINNSTSSNGLIFLSTCFYLIWINKSKFQKVIASYVKTLIDPLDSLWY